jgi:hypothetical protein
MSRAAERGDHKGVCDLSQLSGWEQPKRFYCDGDVRSGAFQCGWPHLYQITIRTSGPGARRFDCMSNGTGFDGRCWPQRRYKFEEEFNIGALGSSILRQN